MSTGATQKGDLFRQVALPDPATGRLYLHSMPGRCEALEQTWAETRRLQVTLIVCLTARAEIRRKSPGYHASLDAGTVPVVVREFAIPDYGVPNDEHAFWGLAQDVAVALREGKRVLVHCGAGIGRTGMFAVAVLMVLGLPREESLAP